ncbi:MAG: PucC family protein, partial [Pseudomonadota bacterium]
FAATAFHSMAAMSLAEYLGIRPAFSDGSNIGGSSFMAQALMAAMAQASDDTTGLALGAWGAVQASATGLAMAIGGGLRDLVRALVDADAFGRGFDGTALGYVVVYNLEILLLFAAMIVLGPLATHQRESERRPIARFGITESPG